MHQFNRFYLLFSIVISFVIPFLTFEIIKIVPVVQNIEPLNTVITSSAIPENEIQGTSLPVEEKINFIPYVLWSLYGIISFLLLIRFSKNIWKLIAKSKSNPNVKYKNTNLVLVEEETLPHTFLNSIFINFEDYNNRNIEDELYSHELVHVTQKHTLDILFIEFLKVIFWFNPIFIFYKKAIQLNHEFLADEEIVKTYNNVPFYQNLLLQKGSNNQTIYLASNLNYSVTKKRLIMMTKSTSKKIALLKKVAVVPILSVLVYFFCIEVVAKEKIISKNQDATSAELINTVELDNSEVSDKRRDTYYSGVYVKITDVKKDTTIKINKMYEDLSLKEKRYYLSWVPSKINPKKVSEELFNKLSNTNKEAVWIDGKAVKNSDLKKYKSSDFKYYTRRFIDKKVRLKQFPQEYQYTLFTNAYFDKNLKDSHVKYEHDTLKTGMIEYQEAKRRYPNNFRSNSQEKNSIVTEASYFKGVRFIYRDGGKNGKVIIDKLYEELTKEDKQKFGTYFLLTPKPLQKMSPTQKEMEEFKNSKKYAIWIDGKHVPNENLSKYKPNEIAHFSGSVILKNARSKRFPQPFQYWFSTHKYFEDTKMGVQKTKYAGDKVEVWHENKSKSNKKENDWEDKKRDFAYEGMTITIVDKKNNVNFTKPYKDIAVSLKQKYLPIHMFYLKEKRIPSKQLFEDFKNKEKYLIFLNDNRIENSQLNKMNVNDIYFYAKMMNPPTSPRDFLYFIYSKDFYEKNLKGKIKDKLGGSSKMKIIFN
ncbi:MAG TPA: hypothetical protein DIU01_11775 [Flavobacterium sp.]|nr:hypothetical protein [Flavobacterium sp.]